MPKLLEEEVAFYREHRAELAERHPGEFVVVKDRTLLGFFPTLRDAYAAAAAHAPKQPALITRLPASAESAAQHAEPAHAEGAPVIGGKRGAWSDPGMREALRAMGSRLCGETPRRDGRRSA